MTLTTLLCAFSGMIVHEFAHARVAELEGDPTARVHGRVTLNPLPHIDPLGSVVLPVSLFLTLGVTVGWFRPVPISLDLLRGRWSRCRVLLAGPASNILVAAVCLLVGLTDGAIANLSLAFFNLLPIPPLDGGLVLQEIVRGRS